MGESFFVVCMLRLAGSLAPPAFAARPLTPTLSPEGAREAEVAGRTIREGWLAVLRTAFMLASPAAAGISRFEVLVPRFRIFFILAIYQ